VAAGAVQPKHAQETLRALRVNVATPSLLGNKRLADLRPSDADKVLAALPADASDSHRRNIIGALRTALRFAHEPEPLTPEQAAALLAAFTRNAEAGNPLGLLGLLALDLGVRQAELCGARWERFSLGSDGPGTWTVTEAVSAVVSDEPVHRLEVPDTAAAFCRRDSRRCARPAAQRSVRAAVRTARRRFGATG
jgi:integrase